MSVDLNSCEKGDKLERRDGKFMTYVKKLSDDTHVLSYENGETAFYTDKGALEFDGGKEWDSDIIRITGSVGEVPTVMSRITLRDWFAGMALQGILASRSAIEREHTREDVAEICFANADAMIKAREVNK